MTSTDADRDYQVQLALLSMQNKKHTGEAPDPAWAAKGLDGRIGNLYVDGSLLCNSCLKSLWSTDQTLLLDLSEHVHVPIPGELRTAPGLAQCFCGYFCFDETALEEHFTQHPRDAKVFAGLLQRAERVDLDPACREKLLTTIQ